MKRIIAYSSIAHMSLAVLGVFANNIQGLQGAMYLMLAHGFVSSALFLLIGVLYDRYHSRFIRHYGGLAQVMPMYAIFFLLFTLANIGFPLTYNFLSEFLVFAAVFREGFWVGILTTTGMLLSVLYAIWLANRLLFGDLNITYISGFFDVDHEEAGMLWML